MKTFKQIDMWGQVALIITLTIVSLIRQDSTFFVAYFIVGGWQVISMLVHHANKWHNRKGSKRYYYHCITLITLALAVLAFALPFLFVIWYLLLFAAPLMAIYYTAICVHEVIYPAKRPLELV